MAETPKSKKARAIERIKELSTQRAAAGRPPAGSHAESESKRPKLAPPHGAAGHRTADR